MPIFDDTVAFLMVDLDSVSIGYWHTSPEPATSKMSFLGLVIMVGVIADPLVSEVAVWYLILLKTSPLCSNLQRIGITDVATVSNLSVALPRSLVAKSIRKHETRVLFGMTFSFAAPNAKLELGILLATECLRREGNLLPGCFHQQDGGLAIYFFE